jgi:YD repeat-containing protein
MILRTIVGRLGRADECGNPRETTDPMQRTTSMFYWVTGSDSSYAFPLLIVNPKGHSAGFVYSSRSGVLLSAMDANGKTTSMLYDNKDRVTRVNNQAGELLPTPTPITATALHPNYAPSEDSRVRKRIGG